MAFILSVTLCSGLEKSASTKVSNCTAGSKFVTTFEPFFKVKTDSADVVLSNIALIERLTTAGLENFG